MDTKYIKRKMKFIKYGFLGLFLILGIIFSSLIVHESVHMFQADKVESVCWDFGSKSISHVNFNVYDEERLTGYMEVDDTFGIANFEKFAYIIQYSFLIVISLVLGFVLGNSRRNKYDW